MKTQAEQRWERMQELLAREAAGHDGPVRVSSQRTLFGIKSHVEEVIDGVAAEDTQRCLEAIDAGTTEPDAHAPELSTSSRAENMTGSIERTENE